MSQLLGNIHDPRDLQGLSLPQMAKLAQEIRDFLIQSVSVTGGHLAPNLGVVELTLALHSCFESPQDKIVWDVGHQSYVHKILTGRREAMSTLRQHQGIAGFPKRYESPHDPIETGHSSTSISSALGLALARDLKKEEHHVVAVIGDGALTGGMAFEALNHAGDVKTNLIVVLNDNEMSIASNVGGMAAYLSRMRSDPRYFKRKEELEELLTRIPNIGPQVVKALERVKDSFKYLLVPGMLFEELGFTYMGPIDGHNIKNLKSVLENAKKHGGPVLVHVLTSKGKGYLPAESKPDAFHGIGPFEIESGKPIKSEGPPSYTKVFSDTMIRLGAQREDVLAITAAMPEGTGLSAFSRAFPARFFDVGIAEQHAVTLASGMALEGFRPVVAIYSTFLQRAYDQIFHDVCLQKAPVIFAIDRAGLVGEDGVTHQGVFDLAYLRHIPEMVVMAPKDEDELQQMLYTAVEYTDGPVALRYPRGAGIGVPMASEFASVPMGKGETVREGNDLAIFAVGPHVYTALKAAEVLAAEGISAAVINPRFIKPLDGKLVTDYAKKTKRILTVEEGCLAGGFGSALLEYLDEQKIEGVEVERIGIPDTFVEHGAVKLLHEELGLTADGVVEKARKLMKVAPPKGKMNVTITFRKESM